MTKTIFQTDVTKYLKATAKEAFEGGYVECPYSYANSCNIEVYNGRLNTANLQRFEAALERLTKSKVWPHCKLVYFEMTSVCLTLCIEYCSTIAPRK